MKVKGEFFKGEFLRESLRENFGFKGEFLNGEFPKGELCRAWCCFHVGLRESFLRENLRESCPNKGEFNGESFLKESFHF